MTPRLTLHLPDRHDCSVKRTILLVFSLPAALDRMISVASMVSRPTIEAAKSAGVSLWCSTVISYLSTVATLNRAIVYLLSVGMTDEARPGCRP